MERDFTSYRFLTLFLHGDEKYKELTQDLQDIRAFITKRVKAINKQGVDIQGWYRQGKKEANVEKVEGGAMTAAARLSTEDRIASTEIFPHVSKIVCNNDSNHHITIAIRAWEYDYSNSHDGSLISIV